MTKMINQLTLQELEKGFEGMGSCVVLGFDKLTVKDDQELRRKFAEAGLSYTVVKNRMAVRAFKARSLDVGALFKGKCGVVHAPEEGAITAAKLVVELIKTQARAKREVLEIRGGLLEGEILDAGRARAMADMPDRQGLRAMLAQVVLAPLTRLALCLNQVGGGLARVIDAHNEKLPAEAPAAAAPASAAESAPATDQPATDQPAGGQPEAAGTPEGAGAPGPTDQPGGGETPGAGATPGGATTVG